MVSVKIDVKDLPAALDGTERGIRRAIQNGALAGAHRGRALIVRRTPVDQGQLRASWRVKPGHDDAVVNVEATLAELINDAPHISIVELGARPHAISPEAWAAIYEWVRRHYRSAAGGVYVMGGAGRMVPRGRRAARGPYKGDDPRIEAITNAIAFKIRKRGQKATLFVRNSVDELREVMGAELQRALARVQSETKKGGGK